MSETALPDDPEQVARVRKLQLEIQLLERQLSPQSQTIERRKANATIAAFVAPLVAVVGLALSSYQWFEASRRASETAINDRIARGLDQLSNPSIPARLTAVATLPSLTNDNSARQQQVFQALLADLAAEESPLVSGAILTAFRQPTTRALPRRELGALLDAALTMSRAIVQEGHLKEGRRRAAGEQPLSPAEHRAENVAEAIHILLHHGARTLNFSRAYLWGVDLRDLDLEGANFDAAVLSCALFDGANVSGASFNNAFLDNTSFVGAHAAFARFDQDVRASLAPSETLITYSGGQEVQLYSQFRPTQTFTYQGPHFDCADLSNATFHNHELFQFATDEFWPLTSQTTSFRGARLDNTDLRSICVVGVAPRDQDPDLPPDLFINSGLAGSNAGGPTVYRAWFDTDPQKFAPVDLSETTRKRFATSIAALTDSFAGSKWQGAKLPRPVAHIFQSTPPSPELQQLCKSPASNTTPL